VTHRGRLGKGAIGVAALAACAAVAFHLTTAKGTPSLRVSAGSLALGVPVPVEPAFSVPTPRPLASARAAQSWAPVLRPVVARGAPRADARAVGSLATSTPEGTANIVLAVGRVEDVGGELWVRVRLPVLPNNTTGWVPRDSLGGYVEVRTHLVVDLERLTATLLKDGRPLFRASVGIGRPAWPTPRGHFYVRSKLSGFGNAFYGPVAFGTSARSAVLTDWPDGGFVGIHGTNRPEILPGSVSHGCIRLRNADILALARLMPVGTPITIR
jgi:lipoprotein-anchoring transpeptidase ErfK/SrfK